MEKIKEETVYGGYMKVVKAEFTDGKNIFSREKIMRPDAVAVLVYNPGKGIVILTKQFRYPIEDREPENLYEVVAGVVDEGEIPNETAVREVSEEVGYNIKVGDLHFLFESYNSVGYSTEKVYYYIAFVDDENKVSLGGGLKSENENIEVVEMEYFAFLDLLRNKQIKDTKTLICGFASSLRIGTGNPRLI